MSDLQDRVDKLETLRLRGTEGEQKAAEKALARILEKYGIGPSKEASEEEQNYKKTKLDPFQKEMFEQIANKHEALMFSWAHKSNFKSVVNFKCTPSVAEKITDEYNRHKEELNEYLSSMTNQYIRQNNLCKWNDKPPEGWGTTVAQEVSAIDRMMRNMNLTTNEEKFITDNDTKQITE